LANKGSAAKRHRQSEKKRLSNRMAKSKVKTEIRKFEEAVQAKDKEHAEEYLKTVIKLIDTAARKNIYHKNTAARKKSRLSKAFNALSA